MWDITPLDSNGTNVKYKYLGRPQKIALDGLWKRGELVKPMEVPVSLLKATAYLGDFGHAAKAGTSSPPYRIQSPASYCAPERFHNINPSFASDIWSYACIFAELYLGFNPLDGLGVSGVLTRTRHALGPLPEQWKGHFCDMNWSKDTWYDQSISREPTWTLEAIIARIRPETSPLERQHVLSFLSKGFCYLPQRRMTAAELLDDASFHAIMEIYRL
jgi:serine/threonine protein kinase